MTSQSKAQQLLFVLIAVAFIAGCSSSGKTTSPDASGGDELEFDSEPSADAASAESGGGLDAELAAEDLSDVDGTGGDLSLDDGNSPSPAPSSPEPQMATAENSVNDLRYVARKSGGTVIIETSSPATFRTREIPAQNQVVIEIANTSLPDRLKRPYVTKDFGQSIASVNAYQDPGSNTARFVIQFKEPMRASVTQSGRELQVLASGAGASSMQTVADSSGGSGGSDDSSSAGGRSGADFDSKVLPSSSIDIDVTGDVRFYGKPINIEVRDTPVKDVINLIAEQSGANLVLAGVGDDGTISLKLKQIPWDQALMIVMKSRNLGYVRQGSVLRIAPLELIQKETDDAKKILDAQKAAEPLKVKVIPVSYAKVDELEKKITPFLTPVRGKVTSDTRTNSVLVTDTPDILDRVTNLIRALDTPPLQVLIEGKVVEAREQFTRNYGIDWGYRGQDVPLGGNLNFSNNLRVTPTNSAGAARLGFRLGTLDLFGDLDATLILAEIDNQVKVLSSPRIVTMNNSPATIVQSTNIFLRQINPNQNGLTTITFQRTPIELRLEVTPQITSESDVIMNMKLRREFAGQVLDDLPPDINTREATTTVMVRNGQTAVIGGVYQSDMTESETGVPLLKDIPLLGWLFKSKNSLKVKSELLLFLTPRILNAEKTLAKESTL